jgi:hypothetical protein
MTAGRAEAGGSTGLDPDRPAGRLLDTAGALDEETA